MANQIEFDCPNCNASIEIMEDIAEPHCLVCGLEITKEFIEIESVPICARCGYKYSRHINPDICGDCPSRKF